MKNIFSKALSAVLSLTLLLSIVSIPTVSAEDDGVVIYKRSYDEEGMLFTDGGGIPAPKTNEIKLGSEGSNKYINIQTAAGANDDCYFEVNFATSKTSFVAEFSLATKTGVNATLCYKDASRKDGILLSIEDLTINSCEQKAGTLRKNKWTDFAVIFNTQTQTMSLYIDGELKLENKEFVKAAPLSGIQLLRFYLPKQDAKNLMIDNFKIYEGSALRDISGEEADTSSITSTVTVPTENIGDAVIYNRTYDEEGGAITDGGAVLATKSNSITVEADKNNNNYVKIETAPSANEDCYFEVGFTSASTSFVTEFSLATETGVSGNLQYKDKSRKDGWLLTFDDANITSCGKTVTRLKKDGSWTDFAIIFDTLNCTLSLYVNGELKIENKDYSEGTTLNGIQLLRFYLPKQDAKNLMIDNFKIYEGDEIRDLNEASSTEETASVNRDFSRLEGAVALKLGVPYALVNLESKAIDEANENVAPFVVNGRTLLPVRFVSEALGAAVEWNNDTRCVTVTKGSDKIELVIGSNILKKNGSDITIDTPAEIYYDRTMLPLRAVAEALGKEVFWDDMGFIVISDTPDIFNRDEDLAAMVAAMAEFVYERPTGEQIIADVKENNPGHPRLLATGEDFDRVRALYGTDAQLKALIDERITSAEALLASYDPEKIVYHVDSGNRLLNPGTASLIDWAFAYQITGDKKYIDASVSMAERLSAWEHWHPGHYLNCAEIVQNVSVAYDWLYNGLTSTQKALFEDTLYKYGITSALGAYRGATDFMNSHGVFGRSGWTETENNWNAFCNGAITQACLALADVDRYQSDVAALLTNIMKSIEIGIRCYAPDGSYPEGPGYWAFGTNNLFMMFESLYASANTTYGLMDSPGLDVTCYYPSYIESPINAVWNYHDSGESTIDTSHFYWVSKYLNEPSIAAIRYNELSSGAKDAGLYDILHYNPEAAKGDVTLSLDKHFSGIKTVTARSSWDDKNAIFTGLHGGFNGENHGDMDAGNFILDAGGIRWISELGMDNYNMPGYFDKSVNGGSWKYYRKGAEGQNVVIVTNDESIPFGANPTANIKISKFESKPKGSVAIADMTENYGKITESAKRGIFFTDNRRTVIVQDEMKFNSPADIIWGAHTEADIKISADGKSAVLSKNGKSMGVKLISPNTDLKFEILEAKGQLPATKTVAGEYDRGSYKKLAVRANGVSELSIAVAFKQILGGETADINYTFTNMDSWSIPDGNIITPKLDAINVNASPLPGFNPDTTSYTFKLPYGETEVPQLTASASGEYNVEITPVSSIGETALIKVSLISDPSMYNIYSVAILATAEVEAEASDTPEASNPASNTLDKNLSTRWAATGTPTITYTFANERTLSAVGVAFWKAGERLTSFKLEISADGVSWMPVYEGVQLNSVDDLHYYEFAPVSAKYVRITGYGNTANDWTSVLEVDFR